MKIFANALALSILLALLAACGDESSSSVSPEPRQCEEQSDDCDDVSSSSEKISKNSSSSQKSADKGKSSSSEKNAKESSSSATTKNSSSSVSGDKSSSSVKKEESSSSVVKVSSSSATPKSSSSEDVKQSSSSVVASSSSVVKSSSSFVRKDYTSADHSYSKLEDPRDHRIYKYLTIRGENKNGERDSVTVMAENLNVGVMVQGADDQSDDTKIEKYCYNNDTLNCYQYGGLYQWAEAMQLPSECNTKSCADLIKPDHQGICPNGWRLLTYDDYYIVVHADENVDPLVEGVRARAFGGHNYSGYSLIGTGIRATKNGGTFLQINEFTEWYYPSEWLYEGDYYPRTGSTSNTTKSFNTENTGNKNKTDGFSIRCVKLD